MSNCNTAARAFGGLIAARHSSDDVLKVAIADVGFYGFSISYERSSNSPEDSDVVSAIQNLTAHAPSVAQELLLGRPEFATVQGVRIDLERLVDACAAVGIAY